MNALRNHADRERARRKRELARRRRDVGAPDNLPECPRCCDLNPPKAERCESCGARLYPLGSGV